MSKRMVMQAIATVAIVGAGLLLAAGAGAQGRNCSPTVVVALGETLRDIARRCDTTVDAIVAANPGVPRLMLQIPGVRIQMPPPPRPANVTRYTVKRGDTLLGIARANGLTLADIIRLNPDIDGSSLRVGDIVLLPANVAPPQPTNTVNYTVRRGDTAESIARDNGTTVARLRTLNPGVDLGRLRRGDVILIPSGVVPQPPPTSSVSYTVRRGDTAETIARDNGTTVAQIRALNPGVNLSQLRRGDVIRIPTGVVPQPPPTTSVNYTVRRGDTAETIARDNRTTVAQIRALNPGVDLSQLRRGDVIRIPTGVAPPSPQPAGPTASVSPAGGAPGLTVRVSASGFPASRQLNLLVGAAVASLQKFQSVTTDTSGTASMNVVVPDWAAGPGTLVFAFETTDGRLRAVSDVFRVSVTPPAPTTVRVVGTLTREGVECQVMRGDDGKLYTLAARNLGDFRPGDRVRVDGTLAAASICQQGITIDVSRIGAAPQQ